MVKIEIVGAVGVGRTVIEHLKETTDVVLVEQKGYRITNVQMIPIEEPIAYLKPTKSGRENRRERRKKERSKKRRK